MCNSPLKISNSSFADDWLLMMARYIMELHPISIEVVQDSNAKLIPFSVVWLRSLGSGIKDWLTLFLLKNNTYPPVCDQATLL